jgi:hypothetical protein
VSEYLLKTTRLRIIGRSIKKGLENGWWDDRSAVDGYELNLTELFHLSNINEG